MIDSAYDEEEEKPSAFQIEENEALRKSNLNNLVSNEKYSTLPENGTSRALNILGAGQSYTPPYPLTQNSSEYK